MGIGMMGGQPSLNQRFILWRKRWAIEFHGATNKQLTLFERQGGQSFQNFGKAHAAKVASSRGFAKLPVKVGRQSGTALAESLPHR